MMPGRQARRTRRKGYSAKLVELDFVHLVEERRGRVRSSPVRHREVMMRTLPAMMLHLLNPFMPLFSRRIWTYVEGLLAGVIRVPGRATVSSASRVTGLWGKPSAFSAIIGSTIATAGRVGR